MPEQHGDKTQEATPYRRQKAREQGQVARSQDLSSALLLVGATLIMMYFGSALGEYFLAVAARQLGEPAWLQTDSGSVVYECNLLVLQLGRALLPILGLLLLLAVVVHLGQVGILFVPQKLAPDVQRINPLKGAQRLLSLTSFVRLGFGLFKITVVAVVAGVSVWQQRDTILSLGGVGTEELCAVLSHMLLSTCLKIGIALLILAIFDYAYQRWKHEQDLRMTTQEVREELKTLQGDPHIAARRRQLQRQLVLQRMQSAVPQADFVVTNPTHLAVAIRYDPVTMEAPVVVAKGADALADKIRRLALEHEVPVLENKPLAQALYKHVDVNQAIPAEHYAAVAEILRYVYQLKGRTLPDVSRAA